MLHKLCNITQTSSNKELPLPSTKRAFSKLVIESLKNESYSAFTLHNIRGFFDVPRRRSEQ